MKSYYVAKSTTSGFIGTFTSDQIESSLKSGVIKPDYLATENSGLSYSQLVESGVAIWMPVSQLQSMAGECVLRSEHQSPAGSRWPKLAIIVTWTAIGPFAGAIIGFYVSLAFIRSEANFMGVGSFVCAIFGAILGLPLGAAIGVLICVFRGKH